MEEEIENTENNDNPEEGGGINPAWNDLLQVIPEDVHEQVIPHLRNWDTGVQNRFQQVQSEWSDYGFLKENEISPDDTRIALGVLRAIQEDPRTVYDSLAESYGYGNKVDEETNGQNTDQGEAAYDGLPDGFLDEFNRLKSSHDTMAQILLERHKQDEEAKQDNDLKTELASLGQKHGKFDEGFVLAQMQNGLSGEDAVKAYQGLVEEIKKESARPPAPRLLGGNSGGMPGEKPLDPTKLNPTETKNLVAKYLEDVKRANQ